MKHLGIKFPLIMCMLILNLLMVYGVSTTPPNDFNGRDIRAIYNFTTINATEGMYINGVAVSTGVVDVNKSYVDSQDVIYNDSMVTYTADTYILLTSESDLNVNHSDTSSTATTWDGETSQSDLNVNHSDTTTLADEATIWSSVTGFATRWFADIGNILTFNETLLNATIDDRDADTTYTAEEEYIYLDTTTFRMNQTVLNATIDDRDADTTYDNGTGIDLSGTTFSLNTAYTDARYYIQSTVDSIISSIGNWTADKGSYDTTVVIDGKIAGVGNWTADKGDYYTSTQTDTEIDNNNDTIIALDISTNASMKDYVDVEIASVNGTLNDTYVTHLEQEINNDTVVAYTDSQDVIYNDSMKDYVDTFYYLKTTVDSIISSIGNWTADKGDYYTSVQVDTEIENNNATVISYIDTQDNLANTSMKDYVDTNYYTQTNVDGIITSIGNWTNDKSSYDTTTVIDGKIAGIGNWTNDKGDYYTSAETDTEILNNNGTVIAYVDTRFTDNNGTLIDYTDTQILNNNATVIAYVDNTFITQANEGNLDVNSANYWDSLNTPADIGSDDITDDGTWIVVGEEGNLNVNHSDTSSTATTWDGETSQSDLDVNSANLWDSLGSPSDINAGDITDDGTYVTVGSNQEVTIAGENITSGTVADVRVASSIARDTELDNITIIRNSNTSWITDNQNAPIENCSVDNSCEPVMYNSEFQTEFDSSWNLTEVSELNNDVGYITDYIETDPRWQGNYTLVFYKDDWNLTQLSELNNDVGYITDGNTGWTNEYGLFDNIANFTGALTNGKWCVYDGSEIDCNIEPVIDTTIENCSVDGSCPLIFYQSDWNLTQLSELNNDVGYVTSDTTYDSGTGINLVGTTFSLSTAYTDARYYIQSTVDSIISSIGNWTNDKSDYYTSAQTDTEILNNNATIIALDISTNTSMKSYVDSVGGSDVNKTYVDDTFRLESWNNLTGIPHATPSNGDTTHFSLADEIYDWVIGLGYSTVTYVDGNILGIGNWSADKGSYDTTTVIDGKITGIGNWTADKGSYDTTTIIDGKIGGIGNWSADKGDYSTTTEANSLYAPINYGDDWNKTYADTLYADISVDGTVTSVTGSAPITSTGGSTPEIGATILKDLVTSSPLTGSTDNVLLGTDSDLTIGITVAKDIVTTAPITGGENNVLTGADADLTIAIPVATTSADGYLSSTDWDTFNDKADSDTTINNCSVTDSCSNIFYESDWNLTQLSELNNDEGFITSYIENDPRWQGNYSAATGTGTVVLSNTPTLITPDIGAATGDSLSLDDGGTIDSGTCVQTFDDTGNDIEFSGCYVGIGTDSPTRQLEVYHPTVDFVLLLNSSDDKTGLMIADDDDIGYIMMGTETISIGGTNNVNNNNLNIKLSNGNVGIGTSSPSKKLAINTSGESNDGLYLYEVDGTFFNAIESDTQSEFAFNHWDDDTTRIYVRENSTASYHNPLTFDLVDGNVGIGTSSPSSSLTVSGTGFSLIDEGNPRFNVVVDHHFNDTASIISGWGNSANPGVIVGTTMAGGDAFSVVTGAIVTDGSWTGASSNTPFYVGGNGNVGIGTTSPSRKFVIDLSDDGSSDDFFIKTASTPANGEMFFGDALASDQTSVFKYSSANGLSIHTFGQAFGTQLFVANDGNVGIGTTSPSEKLDVVGNVDITGTLSKGSGSFRIDNPENPLNEELYHQFYESPEALLAYRGTDQSYNNGHGWNYTVVPLGNNEFIITLPSWFNDLTFNGTNHNEFTGQLTGRNSFCGDSYFNFSSIGDNQFNIVTEKKCEFSWLMNAVRHDPYYENNAMNVVVTKTEPSYTNQTTETVEIEGDYEVTYETVEYTKNIDGKGVCRHDDCEAVEIKKPESINLKEISREKIEVEDESSCPASEDMEEGMTYWYQEKDEWIQCPDIEVMSYGY